VAIIPWKIECLSFRWISPDSNSIHRPAENRTADQTGRENKLRGPRATFTQTTTACRGVGRSRINSLPAAARWPPLSREDGRPHAKSVSVALGVVFDLLSFFVDNFG
jgi:hypothetical protein